MAAAEPKAYANFDQLLTAVAKKTKLEPAQVKAVLSESFPSTRAWVMAEMGKQSLALIDPKKLATKINV